MLILVMANEDKKRTAYVKILQINLNRCRAAQELLEHSAMDRNFDIVLISEPYRIKDFWFSDQQGDAAIWLTPKYLQSNKPTKDIYKGRGFVAANIGSALTISVYLPPSLKMDEFEERISEIEHLVLQQRPEKLFICGDFNAKSTVWGSRRTDKRGEVMLEFCNRCQLTPLRSQGDRTFERNGYYSLIDIALCCKKFIKQLDESKILEDYTGSDHRYVSHTFRTSTKNNSQPVRGCITGKIVINFKTFKREYSTWMEEQKPLMNQDAENPSKYVDGLGKLVAACNKIKQNNANGKNQNWWWHKDLEKLRKAALKARRNFQKTARKGTATRIEECRLEYKHAKCTLNKAIGRAKGKAWKELVDKVDLDVWGKPYKTVMKILKGHPPPHNLDLNEAREIIGNLFIVKEPPNSNTEEDTYGGGNDNLGINIQGRISSKEVEEAAGALKSNKAVGPDGIPADVIKWLSKYAIEHLTELINICWRHGKFPEAWKIGRLVLLPKPAKPPAAKGWRPLTILSNLGKMFEYVIKKRIQDKIKLSDNQYGFSKGKSTIDAMSKVTELWEAAKSKKLHCLIVTLDVKNAFNTLSWNSILRVIKNSELDKNTINTISDYLHNRKIRYKVDETWHTWNVYGGVPQGSVLGPTLWNLVYDGLLTKKMTDGIKIIGYADDVALVISNRTIQGAQSDLNEAMKEITVWFENEGLELAQEKTEMVLLTGRRIRGDLLIQAGAKQYDARGSLRYLGIQFQGNTTFREHVATTSEKAISIMGALTRIMPNIGGGGYNSRMLYYRTVEAVVMYGAPIWHPGTKYNYIVNKLRSVQKLALGRVCRAYRTVSLDALCVLTGCPPWKHVTQMLFNYHKRLQETTRDGPIGKHEKKIIKKEEKEKLMAQWQKEWNVSKNGRWTHKLIPDIGNWIDWGPRTIDFHSTQIITGHGCFAAYKNRIGKDSDGVCWFCNLEKDDAYHTTFTCPKWENERSELESKIGNLNEEKLIMGLKHKEMRPEILNYLNKVMRSKEEYEREKELRSRIGRHSAQQNPD